MAPVRETVHLIVGIRPAVIYLAPVERREMMPTSYIRILNDTGHVAIFPFQFAVIVKFRHHDRCENTVFGSRLTDVDGDFLRLNKCANDDERRSQVSLQLIAGGPVTIADTPETIGNLDKFYTNEELLALNTDGFIGKPLSDEIDSEGSCIWYGTMSNGDVVMAMFNREEAPRKMSVNLSEIGLSGEYKVRDLWKHADESAVESVFTVTVPRHGCKVVKLTK